MKIVLETAGSSVGDLVCSSVNSECGSIVGGVALEFEHYPYAFVVSFEDFEKLYLYAKSVR